MKRKKIAAANWKMNTTVTEGHELLSALVSQDKKDDVDVVICAPCTHLYALSDVVASQDRVQLGAQNMSQHLKGAYTGEVSAHMIKSCKASHVVIGHSERRQHFGEDDQLLSAKLGVALNNDLTPIFCCGESLDIRKSGNHVNHVINQLDTALSPYSADDLRDLVIAYEPIWAIGTGETASPAQAQEMHLAIREFLKKKFGAEMAEHTPILYGGSVKPHNAAELFRNPDVDGGLVGGASLDASGFAQIINSFE
jgi:triosephosphate isomerase